MTEEIVIPGTYEQWRDCIEVHCGIPLTPAYVAGRLNALQDSSHAKTREFARLYGNDHLQRTILWFRQAADDPARRRQ